MPSPKRPVLADEKTHAVATSEVPIALTRVEGRQVVERWLTESRVARDTIRFALPPSMLSLGAGDVIALDGEQQEGQALYRIDRVEQGALQIAEAVRIDPEVYTPSDLVDEVESPKPFVASTPVFPLFLDLPLITGDENPPCTAYCDHRATVAGLCRCLSIPSESDYQLLDVVDARSIVGQTETAMAAAPMGQYDLGTPLRVKLLNGALSSVEEAALLSGANLAAIGDGSSGKWELFQFAKATLVDVDTYELSERLRGQFGSDGVMENSWPEGSWFVLLNGLPEQIDLSRNLRLVGQSYRIGPARRSVDDPSFVERREAFSGNGLRPYAPVHLRAKTTQSGAQEIRWIRRTRIDGDGWDAPDVPLGEEVERYLIEVVKDGVVLREANTQQPVWIYPLSEQASDGLTGSYEIRVSQVSATFGPGPAATLTLTV